MKTTIFDISKLGIVLLALSFAMVSCSKDEENNDDDNNNNNQQEEAQTFPTPGDADGTLVAVKSVSIQDTPIGPIEIQIGTAVGVFTDDGFTSGDFISAGMVTCNGSELGINANNSYTFTDITATNPTGIDFNNDVEWDVTGANGIPAFNFNADVFGFPSATAITSSTTVDKADGYTVTCNNVSGADSTLFNIGGAIKTLAGNATSCTFTAAELADVATGMSVVQVVPYVIGSNTFGSKKIYFVNEYVQSQSVTVQ